ncbi:SDR family oxidoreductase [Embleya sp. NPDC001921]
MILVTGGTGRVGTELVRVLTGLGAAVRVLTRAASKAEPARARGAEVAVGDMNDPQSLEAALRGVDRVFLLSKGEPAQIRLQHNIVVAAAAARIRRLVKVSAMGAGPDCPQQEGRWHARTEDEIAATGIAFTHLRPNFFMQNLSLYTRSLHEGVLRAPMGNGRISMIDHRDVAAVAATVLTEDGHDNRIYTLTGPEALSFIDVAARLSTALGRRVRYSDVPLARAREHWLARGLPSWQADSLADLHRAYRTGWAAEPTTTVADLTRRPPRSLDTVAVELVQGLAAHP